MIVKRFVATMAASLACLCFGGIAAQASEPVSGSGTFQASITPMAVQTADGNTFITAAFVETTTGLLAGTRVGQVLLVIHPDGTVTARTSGVFNGTVAGSASGTAIFKGEVEGTFAALTGELQAGDGSGGLTGLHGNAVFSGHSTGPTTFAGTYSGQAQFGAP